MLIYVITCWFLINSKLKTTVSQVYQKRVRFLVQECSCRKQPFLADFIASSCPWDGFIQNRFG